MTREKECAMHERCGASFSRGGRGPGEGGGEKADRIPAWWINMSRESSPVAWSEGSKALGRNHLKKK